MRIHDFSHISHILTSTERFMKKLLILLLGLLLLQISYSRSVLIPKNRPELVISKIYNPSSGKILVIYQCKDWLNRVTNSFAAPEFMIRIGSTIMSLWAADYDWPVSGGPGLPLPVDLLGLDRRTVQLLVERFEHASVDFGQLGLHLRRA